MTDARKAAVSALLRILGDGKFSNLSVGDTFSNIDISDADRALATNLIYGTLDRLYTIDEVLRRYVKKGIKSIPPYSLCVMRCAVYQLLFTDKIPDSAAVNEAVKAVKNSKESRVSGFVNAVLRNIVREKEDVNLFIQSSEPYIKYSCNKSIYLSLCRDYGKEAAEEILKSFLLPPVTYLRVNTLKTDVNALVENFGDCVSVICDGCLKVEKGFSVENDKSYNEGLYHAEGIASQYSALAAAENGGRILDVCAAPGGKSFTAAEVMGGKNEVVACDIYPHRVKLIENGAKRLGLACIVPTVNDATVYNEKLGFFDTVLCDVPCSGLGVISRKPDIKLRDVEIGIENTQYKILDVSAKYVKPNGRLVYSTCTLRRAENEEVTAKFLKEHPEFSFDKTSYCDKTFFPHIDFTDGFFISVFRKSGEV